MSEPAIDPATLQAASGRDLTDMQGLLALVAKNLAPLGEGVSVAQHIQDVIQSKLTPASQADATPTTAGAAGDFARGVMLKILARFAEPAPPTTPSPASSLYRGH